MRPIVHTCIKRWRAANPEKYREQLKKSNDKINGWKKISREFRNILKSV